MVKLSQIFDIYTGSKLDYGKQTPADDGITFVSRNSNNNGVVGKVEFKKGMKVYKKGDITVPLGGSFLLSAFVQNEDFVTAKNVDVLRPKKEMQDIEKWFYCYVLRMNRFKFSAFGREVNKYIQDIEVPETIPSWVYTKKIELPKTKNTGNKLPNLNVNEWKEFKIKELFKIERGTITSLNKIDDGEVPIVSATDKNQGIAFYGNVEAKYNNCLTASFNGVGTGFVCYHNYSFNANTDCGVLIPKFKGLNSYIGLFISTILNMMKYKYSYGRKLSQDRLAEEIIKLPVKNDIPDWAFMENYIKQMPYGDII